MARTSKELLPVDARIADLLATAIERSGLSQRDLASRAGLSQNRLGIILRKQPPPATVGEVGAIAAAVGTTASAVIAQAEAGIAAEARSNITPLRGRNVRGDEQDRSEKEVAWGSEIDHDQDHDEYDA